MGSIEEDVVLFAAQPPGRIPSQSGTPGQVSRTIRGVLLGVMELQGFS